MRTRNNSVFGYFSRVRHGSIHAQGVARRLSILCIIIYSKYVKRSRDSQLNHRLSQYASKRSKTCRCFSTKLLPMQPKFWRSQKRVRAGFFCKKSWFRNWPPTHAVWKQQLIVRFRNGNERKTLRDGSIVTKKNELRTC